MKKDLLAILLVVSFIVLLGGYYYFTLVTGELESKLDEFQLERDKTVMNTYEIGYIQGCRDYQEIKGYSPTALNIRLLNFAKKMEIDTTYVVREKRVINKQ